MAPLLGPVVVPGIIAGTCERSEPFTFCWEAKNENEEEARDSLSHLMECHQQPKDLVQTSFHHLPVVHPGYQGWFNTAASGGHSRFKLQQALSRVGIRLSLHLLICSRVSQYPPHVFVAFSVYFLWSSFKTYRKSHKSLSKDFVSFPEPFDNELWTWCPLISTAHKNQRVQPLTENLCMTATIITVLCHPQNTDASSSQFTPGFTGCWLWTL